MRLRIHDLKWAHLLDGLHFFLALARVALLGVGRQGVFSSHQYLIFLSWLAYDQNCCCLFLHGEFPRPWPFRKILRTQLYIEGSPLLFNGSDVFGRGSKRALWNFRSLSTLPDCGTPLWSSWRLSLLFPGSWLSDRLPGGFSWDHGVPVVPFWKGLQSFWRYCFARERNVLVSLVPAFLFCLSVTKKVSSVSIPWSLTGLLW